VWTICYTCCWWCLHADCYMQHRFVCPCAECCTSCSLLHDTWSIHVLTLPLKLPCVVYLLQECRVSFCREHYTTSSSNHRFVKVWFARSKCFSLLCSSSAFSSVEVQWRFVVSLPYLASYIGTTYFCRAVTWSARWTRSPSMVWSCGAAFSFTSPRSCCCVFLRLKCSGSLLVACHV